MELCPCSPDIGDCNRCGKRYPLETMEDLGLPPLHKKPVKGSEITQRSYEKAVQDKNPMRQQMYKTLLKQVKKNEAERSQAIKEYGVASNMAGITKRNVDVLTLKKGGKTRRNKSSGGDIVSHLLTIRNQVKLYHWQTGSFARHKATDDLTAALDLAIDSFVESYMGRYGRPKVSGSIKLHNFSESAAKTFVSKETKYLSTQLPKKIKSTDSDLLNIRDEILAELTKVSYLFTLQ
jgi:hypothetical protein